MDLEHGKSSVQEKPLKKHGKIIAFRFTLPLFLGNSIVF